MRTNIDLHDHLAEEIHRLSSLPTKKAVVDEALATLIRSRREREALAMCGRLGELDASREGCMPEIAPTRT